ncbi:MAG TPA: efflux RND transporter periplasmic adaptor subunit [Cyclobacteriaceae bacterium]|nr:efflux RND transporter periplasmic adaptor subunit [Cyclobacteriaceae bacterium]
MNTMNKYFQFSLLILLTAVLFSCGTTSTDKTEVQSEADVSKVQFTAAQLKTANVTTGKIEQKQISGTIKVNGVLDVPPQQLVSVSVPFGGFVKSTSVLQGTRVQKGQLIATIENPEYIQFQQDYLEAKNEFEFAKTDYERQQQLSVENVNSQKTLQQAKASYQNWMAKKNGLQAKLKLINIDLVNLENGNITSTANVYSAINGFVTEVNVNIGKFVNPTDVLFEIVDTEHLHAELIIFEKDIPKIKIGQKVRFTLANETVERMATVYLIGREISPERTIRIHCHIDKEDKNLLPGMYLKAMVETGSSSVNALPDAAIVDFQGKKYVFILGEETKEGTHFTMVEITTGNSELGFTEVFLPENVSNDAQIAVTGAYSILSKIKNIEEEEGH